MQMSIYHKNITLCHQGNIEIHGEVAVILWLGVDHIHYKISIALTFTVIGI